jgi:hypothetical protein
MLNILLLFTTSNARSSITFHGIRISNTPRSLLSTHSNTYCQNTRCMTDRQTFSQGGFKQQILIIYIYIYTLTSSSAGVPGFPTPPLCPLFLNDMLLLCFVTFHQTRDVFFFLFFSCTHDHNSCYTTRRMKTSNAISLL